MKLCPTCGSNDWRLGRTHTVWEVLHVSLQQDANGIVIWEETGDPGDFGDTIETGEPEELTCNQCETAVNPYEYLF